MKNLFNNYKKPNGKKGGIISLYASISFCLITIIALITKDWFIILLTLIISYLVVRCKIEDNLNYKYQIILGIILGIIIPVFIFYIYNNSSKLAFLNKKEENTNRMDFEDIPKTNLDNRMEADFYSEEFKIED